MGSDYATALILDICGGEASEITVCGEENYKPAPVCLRPERVKTLAGLDVSEDEIVRILTALGFEVSRENGCLKTVSPTWRGDIECEADLVEEVVRMAGLDNIPALSMPADEFPSRPLNPAQRRAVTVKHELAARANV